MRLMTTLVLCGQLALFSATERTASAGALDRTMTSAAHAPTKKPVLSEPDTISIEFDHLSDERGLTLSISTVGDADGQTTFANRACCGIEDAHQFVRGVRIQQGTRDLLITHTAAGWTVDHEPGATLKVTYQLPATAPLRIDSGTSGLMTPTIHKGRFHLFGNQAFLLPIGRASTDLVNLRLDASHILGEGSFASSFGPGAAPLDALVERSEIGQAVYLGGEITLTVTDTPGGRVGVAHSAMNNSVQGQELTSDALAIVEATRTFFDDEQPWYLISVLGATRGDSPIHVGGGTGVTNAFAMFVASDLDFSNEEHREQFRWVLSHEYFHQWNGLTIRVASRPDSERDDQSVYWFSEGVTEFYAMRLLARSGLQTSVRSVDILNNKLSRYAQNSKRGISAEAAGLLFWTDPDGEQIPYLRGYLAAWYADMAIRRHSNGARGLDQAMRALVKRSRNDPQFRVSTAFLAAYLGKDMALERRPPGFE